MVGRPKWEAQQRRLQRLKQQEVGRPDTRWRGRHRTGARGKGEGGKVGEREKVEERTWHQRSSP